MNQLMQTDPLEFGAIAAAIGALIFAAAFGLAWVWGRSRSHEQVAARIRELEVAAGGHQDIEAELRRQAAELRSERDVLQEKLSEEQQRRVSAETIALKARENLDEQKKLFEQARAQLTEAFQSIASDALGKSTQQFLELANSKFETLRGDTVGDLELRKLAIEGLVAPLEDTLGKLNERLTQVESSRSETYGELRAQMQMLAQTSKELRDETGTLSNSLRQPQVRGRWGELTLRRAVELAGLTLHCDFSEQVSVEGESGRLRPDMIVHLPGGTSIVVDAKVPLHQFIAAASAETEAARETAMSEHARLVRNHVQQLSAREYWKQFDHSPEFVVLFVPGESFFSAALQNSPTLIEDAINKRVVLASPTTLIALLRAIAYGWRQEQLADNAAHISELGRDLHERLAVFAEHLAEVGRGLEKANDTYTKAVRSFNTRLWPAASKFHELGVATSKEIEPLDPVESLPEPIIVAPPDGNS
jgi:DNA recombination protein RmuC